MQTSDTMQRPHVGFWGACLAGIFVALAVELALGLALSAIGLYGRAEGMENLARGAGIALVAVPFLAAFAGGLTATKVAPDAHLGPWRYGLVVFAGMIIVGAFALASGLGGILNLAGGASLSELREQIGGVSGTQAARGGFVALATLALSSLLVLGGALLGARSGIGEGRSAERRERRHERRAERHERRDARRGRWTERFEAGSPEPVYRRPREEHRLGRIEPDERVEPYPRRDRNVELARQEELSTQWKPISPPPVVERSEPRSYERSERGEPPRREAGPRDTFGRSEHETLH